MSAAPSSFVFVTLPREDRRSDQFLGQLARALSTQDGIAGVGILETVGVPSARLLVYPASLLEAIEPFGEVERLTHSVLEREGAASSTFGSFQERFGYLVPARAPTSSSDRSPRGGADRPSGLASLASMSGVRIDVRTFWIPRSAGGLWVARCYRSTTPRTRPWGGGADPAGSALAQHWSILLQRPVFPREVPGRRGADRWKRWTSASTPREAWIALDATAAAEALDPPRRASTPAALYRQRGHLSVFGTPGAGKTSLLAELAAEAIRAGDPVVAIDLHGDLAPAVLDRLSAPLQERVVALDATDRPVPGINVLADPAGHTEERSIAHLVSALKRLSPDGEGIYWGFRLERIFDSFLRLVKEEGGTLADVAALLERPERREAMRVKTRRAELARFLDELEPILKRQPDFLWPAAARISKVVLSPALKELLSPEGPALPWEAAVREGRSLLVRLPYAEIGSEAAGFASTLLLAHIYLSLAAEATRSARSRPVLLLLDEAQGFSPRLLTEVLTEGRKFGLRVAVSTQYPERLAPEVERALKGAVAAHLCFRVALSNARATAVWLGIDRAMDPRALASLPTGRAILVDQRVGELIVPAPPPVSSGTWRRWKDAVGKARRDVGLPVSEGEGATGPDLDDRLPADPVAENVLLAVYAAQETAGSATQPKIMAAAVGSLLSSGEDGSQLLATWDALVGRRWIQKGDRGWTLGSAGAEALGLGRRTGAPRESTEHRALLLEAYRLFARRGCRLDLLRQGRFDTTLPDARLDLLPPSTGRPQVPKELAARLDRVRQGWAWRFFHGRNVHVEAEVSGALRRERIRHGCQKAMRADSFALFLVSDAPRARRVRSVLRELGLGLDRAQVWTLPRAALLRPPIGKS